MDLVTLVFACAFESIPDPLLYSMALVESNATEFYVRAQARPEGIDYRKAADALEAIPRLVERAGGAYVGLMGVPVAVAAQYDVPPPRLLKPCDNVRLASTMLAAYRATCEHEIAPDPVGCVLARYGEATGFQGRVFAEEVMARAVTPPPKADDPTPAELISKTIVFDSAAGDDTPSALFFEVDLDRLVGAQVHVAKPLEDAP